MLGRAGSIIRREAQPHGSCGARRRKTGTQILQMIKIFENVGPISLTLVTDLTPYRVKSTL